MIDLAAISDEQACALYFDWDIWARPKQKEPPGNWRVWLILAGRGFGKTRTGAEWIRAQVEQGKCKRLALVGRTAADVRDVMVEGESGILACSPPRNRPHYEPSKRRLTWPNGAMATTYSADEPDALRGPQHDGFWCLVGDTPVLMADGSQKPIAEVQVGDSVMTRQGARNVTGHYLTKRNAEVYLLRSMGGRSIIGTANHPVWVEGRGFIPMSMLSEGMSLCVTNVSNGTAISGINDLAKTTMNGVSCSIERYGSKPMGLFQRAAIFTIGMATRLITGLKIWNCSHMANTAPCTTKKSWLPIGRLQELIHRKLWSAIGKYACNGLLSVLAVEKNIIAPLRIQRTFAHQNALKLLAQELFRVTCAHVSIAQLSIEQQSERNGIVHENAMHVPLNQGRLYLNPSPSSVRGVTFHSSPSVQTHASVHGNAPLLSTATIATVEKLATRCDVYDITIEDAHEFFADGILVHNSDEPASWQHEETWDNLMFGLRLGKNPRGVATTTPKPTKLIKTLISLATTYTTRGNSYENRANLAPAFFEDIIRRYEGTRLGRQEINAEILDDNPGALWKRDWIERNRVVKHPDLKRIVVAIDPPGSSAETSDEPAEAGIIVEGLGVDNHGYVLADYSLVGTPNEWAAAGLTAYNMFQADIIIAEVNFGGEMVGSVIKLVAKEKGMGKIPFEAVHASRGKQIRAEPVSNLYQQDIIHHVGTFPHLEDQQCNWLPGEKSPDRLDANVWGFTKLIVDAGPSAQAHLDYARRYQEARQKALEAKA